MIVFWIFFGLVISYLAVFIFNYKLFSICDQIDEIQSSNYRRRLNLASSAMFLIGTLIAMILIIYIICLKYGVGDKIEVLFNKIVSLLNGCLKRIENCPPNFKKKDKA